MKNFELKKLISQYKELRKKRNMQIVLKLEKY